MGEIFIKILNMSISASWLILAVIVMRLVLKKAPKWLMCLLWGLVAIKLIVPFTPESIVSLIPSGEVIPENITETPCPHINSGIVYVDTAVNPMMQSNLAPQIGDSANPMQIVVSVASIIWCVGVSICLLYALISYVVLKMKVRASKKVMGNVYACDEVKSPFILGVFRPVIYIPSGMDSKTLDYVTDHENAHMRRGDHFWKPLGFIILSVYWFNPLCWVAYILLCRDIEYACDEKVIRDKDRKYTNSYSQALLDCNAHRKIIAACPLAFGETGVKSRIKNVLNYKKPAFWIIIFSLIACIVVAICFMTKKKDAEPGRIPPEMYVELSGSEEKISATVRTFTWAEDSIGSDDLMPFEDLHPELDHSITGLKLDDSIAVLKLLFEDEPDEVIVKCWDESYVDGGGELGEGFVQLQYNAENHTIEIPASGNLYCSVRASWENKGGASYAFHIERDNTAGLNEKNAELYVSMQVIDDKHADFLLEASDGSQSWVESISYILLYFSGDYSFNVLEMLTDPKNGQEYAFMYDSLEKVAVGKVMIDKKENGIILHADMSAAGSWEGLSFSNLEYCELRYQIGNGEEYSSRVNLIESTTQLDGTITFMATVDEVTSDGYIIVHVDQSVIDQNVEVIESGKNYMLSLEKYDPGIYVDSPVPGNVVIITCKSEITDEDPAVINEVYSISPIGSSPMIPVTVEMNVSDWISEISLPEGYSFGEFIPDGGYGGCFLISPRVYNKDEESGVPLEWQYSGALTRISADNSQVNITYENGIPNLSGVPIHNHTYAEYISVIGLERSNMQWPAIMLKENHDSTGDYWYFWFVKEGEDTYYVLSLSVKEFSKEQAIAIAETVSINY